MALLEQGYSRRFAIGSITSGGTLGIINPPSLQLIAYGLATDQSISDLFIAGIVPGLVPHPRLGGLNGAEFAGLLPGAGGGGEGAISRRLAR